MGSVLLHSLFLTGQTPLWGAASPYSNPVLVAFFRVAVGALDVRAARAFPAFPFDLGNCGLLLYLACRSLCEVGMAWPGDVRA